MTMPIESTMSPLSPRRQPSNPRPRVVILDPKRHGSRNAVLRDELARRTEIVGVVNPTVSRVFDIANKARWMHPDRDTWRARAGFSSRRFTALSRSAAAGLAQYEHDVALQFYPVVFAPPLHERYVVYTDNTMAVTQRLFPRWANLTPKEVDRAISAEAETLRAAKAVATMGQQSPGLIDLRLRA